jgi:hypothetical protein
MHRKNPFPHTKLNPNSGFRRTQQAKAFNLSNYELRELAPYMLTVRKSIYVNTVHPLTCTSNTSLHVLQLQGNINLL